MADAALIGPVEAPYLHVMSFNIRRRIPQRDPQSPDRWDRRRPLVKRMLTVEQPTLLGTQEVMTDQVAPVLDALGPRYETVGHGREANSRGEACPIFYDRGRLDLLDWRQDALSDTPDVPGSVSWGNDAPRIVVHARFRDRATDTEFQFINTHLDHHSRSSRLRAVTELRELVRSQRVPAIITGDFNTGAGSSPHQGLVADGELHDTWKVARERLTKPWGTYPNYGDPEHRRKRIDWIVVTPEVTVHSAAINATRYEGRWPSDHAPVQAVVTLGHS